jgi:hypothetical protein
VKLGPFGTHAVVKQLPAAGFTDVQAETLTGIVREIQEMDFSSLAVKAELAMFATKVDLAEVKAALLKWMVGSIGIQTIVIIGAVLTLAKTLGH